MKSQNFLVYFEHILFVKLLVIQKIHGSSLLQHLLRCLWCVKWRVVLCKMRQRELRQGKNCSLQPHVMNNYCSPVRRASLLRLIAAGMSLSPTLMLGCLSPASCDAFRTRVALIVLGTKLVFNERQRSSMQVTTFEPRQNPHARFMIYGRAATVTSLEFRQLFPNKVNKLLIYSSKMFCGWALGVTH